MKTILALALPLIAIVGSAQAQPPWYRHDYRPPPFWRAERNQVANLDGTWFFNGDPNQPAHIYQRWPDDRALFVNEKGSEAWGYIRGNQVWIPDWNNGQGQSGTVVGDRIDWPGGSFWSR
jgi:hypothetical protein